MCHAQIIDQAIRKARKQHSCTECGKRIEPGEKYEYTFGEYEGQVYNAKLCKKCYILWDIALQDLPPGSCINFGDIREYVREWNHEFKGFKGLVRRAKLKAKEMFA